MKKKLGLQDFADYIAQHEGVDRKTADAFVRSFFDVIEQGLSDDKLVKIKGFGTFKLVAVSERESVNINTGERFQISGHTKVSFTPDASMKELVNQPFAHFEAVDLNDDTDTKEFELIDDEMEEEEEEELAEKDADENDEDRPLKVDSIENIAVASDEALTTPSTSNDNIIELANEADNANNADTEPQVTAPSSVIVNASANNKVASSSSSSANPLHQPQSLNQPTPVMSIDTNEDNDTEQASATTHNQEPHATSDNDNTIVGNAETTGNVTAPHTNGNNANDENTELSNDEDIVVTPPTPISEQATDDEKKNATTGNTASPATNNVSNTMGYTYNEVPSPRKRNWWKIISLTLLVLLLMTGSYFAGYYRMLCPHCYDDEPYPAEQPQPVASTVKPQPATNNDSTPIGKTDSLSAQANHRPTNVANDNAAAVQKDETPSSTPTKEAETNKATATSHTEAANKTSTPKRPATHRVNKGENVYRIARKYYGSDNYAEKIIQANNLKNANNIVVGMELKLP